MEQWQSPILGIPLSPPPAGLYLRLGGDYRVYFNGREVNLARKKLAGVLLRVIAFAPEQRLRRERVYACLYPGDFTPQNDQERLAGPIAFAEGLLKIKRNRAKLQALLIDLSEALHNADQERVPKRCVHSDGDDIRLELPDDISVDNDVTRFIRAAKYAVERDLYEDYCLALGYFSGRVNTALVKATEVLTIEGTEADFLLNEATMVDDLHHQVSLNLADLAVAREEYDFAESIIRAEAAVAHSSEGTTRLLWILARKGYHSELPTTLRRYLQADPDVDESDPIVKYCERLKQPGSSKLPYPGKLPKKGKQIHAPDRREEIAALIPQTSYIPNDTLVAHVEWRLKQPPSYVVLTGTAGGGKTRLALELARSRAELEPTSVVVVPLADCHKEADIWPQIARACGLYNTPLEELEETTLRYLTRVVRLLVLDNCEHLPMECRGVVEAIIGRAKHPQVLLTSRDRLRWAGELAIPIQLLAVPSEQGSEIELRSVPAGKLLQDRLTHPDIDPTALAPEHLVRICRWSEGIPLVLELIAAWLPEVGPEQVTNDLLDRSTDMPPHAVRHHATLRSTLQWSYVLLGREDPEEQRLFRRLAAFVGGWTASSARQLFAEDPGELRYLDRIPALLQRLASHSLIVEVGGVGSGRFRFLVPVQEFAADVLRSAPDEYDATKWRHARWASGFLKEHLGGIEAGGERATDSLVALEAEYPNLLEAIRWYHRNGAAEELHWLAGNLITFWQQTGRHAEGQSVLAQARSLSGSSKYLYKVYSSSANLAFQLGDFSVAVKWRKEAIRQSEEDDADRRVEENDSARRVAVHRGNLGYELACLGRYDEAENQLQQALAVFAGEYGRPITEPRRNILGRSMALVEYKLGIVDAWQGAFPEAHDHYLRGLELLRASKAEPWRYVLIGAGLGSVACRTAQFALAHAYLTAASRLARELNDIPGIMLVLRELTHFAVEEGRLKEALTIGKEALEYALQYGFSFDLALVLADIAAVAYAREDDESSALIWDGASALLAKGGAAFPPIDGEQYEPNHQAAKAATSPRLLEAVSPIDASIRCARALELEDEPQQRAAHPDLPTVPFTKYESHVGLLLTPERPFERLEMAVAARDDEPALEERLAGMMAKLDLANEPPNEALLRLWWLIPSTQQGSN